jgi:hypothetical protein
MDDEIKGEGNSANYKFRMHDTRVGRFFAVDPLAKKFPHMTPYQFAGNNIAWSEKQLNKGGEELEYQYVNKEATPVVVYNFEQMDEGMQIEIITEEEDGGWQRDQIDVNNDNYQPNTLVADWKTYNIPKNADPKKDLKKVGDIIKSIGSFIIERMQKVTFPIYLNEDIYNHKKNGKEC